MKWLVFGSILILASISVLVFNHYYEERRHQIQQEGLAFIQEANEADELSRLLKSQSKDRLVALEGRIKKLSGVNKQKVEPVWQLAVATAVFEEAEGYLAKATEINNALKLPKVDESPQSQEPPNKLVLHPLVVQNLELAIGRYKETKELCDRIQVQPDNDRFNFSLNYFKGEVYYRHTQFLSTKETVKELFDQTLICWKHALRYKSCDIDTVVNIELLIKNKDKMLNNASSPRTQRPQMLPAAAGRSNKKGI